jgi:hypothetical protein
VSDLLDDLRVNSASVQSIVSRIGARLTIVRPENEVYGSRTLSALLRLSTDSRLTFCALLPSSETPLLAFSKK